MSSSSSTWRQTHTRAADNSWIRNHTHEFSHSNPQLYGASSSSQPAPPPPTRRKSMIATLMLPLAMAASSSTRKSFTSAASSAASPLSSSSLRGEESPEMKMARTGAAPSPVASSFQSSLAAARGSTAKEQVAARRIQRAFRQYQGKRMARIRRLTASSQTSLLPNLSSAVVEREAMPTYSVRKQSPISLSTGFSFTRGNAEAEDYEFA
ncbi:hypothetical protein BASA81_015055 [Batrachochytrium salamandrivorans]|nr:hypothetical protein BASA81_015055 [Batrachochytrium salamandrivorans]